MQNEKCGSQIAAPVAPNGELIDIINDLSDNGGLDSISHRLRLLLNGLRGESQEPTCDPGNKPSSVIEAAAQANGKKYALLAEIGGQLSELETLLRS